MVGCSLQNVCGFQKAAGVSELAEERQCCA